MNTSSPPGLDPITDRERALLDELAQAREEIRLYSIRDYDIEILEAALVVAELAVAGEYVFRSVAAANAMRSLRKAHEAAGDLEATSFDDE